MARYRIKLAYDGTEFHGSQIQPGLRTVQGEAERALKKLAGQHQSILFAGRTDAGVHASGQVISFELDWNHPEEDLQKAFNALLPRDVSALEVAETGEDFHPRFDARFRRYSYSLRVNEHRDPLQNRYCWRVWPPLSLPRLEKASQCLLGLHDFGAFGSPHQPGGCTVRKIELADWKQTDERYQFELTGNAFLYHMVRHIVIILVKIGQKKEDPTLISKFLREPEGPPAQGLAPARGLQLAEVVY